MNITVNGQTYAVPAEKVQDLINWLNQNASRVQENFTPFDNTESLPAGALGNQRGIAFQTIFPNVNKSNALENTAPALGPISTISDLFDLSNAVKGVNPFSMR